MTRKRTTCRSRWLGTGIVTGAAALFLVPSAGLAVGAVSGVTPAVSSERSTVLTPASVDPQLARFVAERSGGLGGLKRFTPAGVDARATRTMTVAVRVDSENSRAIQVRSAVEAAQEQVTDSVPGIRIASTRYNLGLSRGYQNFAQSTPQPAAALLSESLSDAAIPNLADFRPSRGAAKDETRFAARIAQEKAGVTGGNRTLDPSVEEALDIAGSYRLTRNLDVTAGVRYSQERDRATPLQRADQDAQAVYIGTQFRF